MNDRKPDHPPTEGEIAVRERDRLRAQLARFAAAAPAVFLTVRRRPDGSMCVPFATERIHEIYGLLPAQIVDDATPIFERIHPDDMARVRESLRVSAEGTDWACEYRVLHPERGELWIGGHASPEREDDGGVIWYGFLLEITARRKLEAQLLHAQKMESIGRLAGGVAHDFNNILTVVSGCVSELYTISPEGKPRELLTEVSDAVDRASALTRQLLAFSRQQMLEPREIDLNSVVLNAERMLGRLLGEDVALRVRLGRELRRIKADPGYVTQVLVNLAVNARDAMPQGGHLAIETRNVLRDAAACARHPGAVPGPHVLLMLADNGCGMSDEVKARAFEPFFSTKGVGKGTGLGMCVTHGIVEQAGGHLELTSAVNVGTEIAIYFPALPEASVSTQSIRPIAISGSEKIMVVEDDRGVRRVSVRILKGAGYTVIEAESGAQALELHRTLESPIDLLVTDVVMPEMDGRQLAEALQALQPGLKVLYLSGYTGDAVVRYGISHAEVAFLQKPFSPASLTAKIREIFDSRDAGLAPPV